MGADDADVLYDEALADALYGDDAPISGWAAKNNHKNTVFCVKRYFFMKNLHFY
jgi:hypothetical protein